MDPSQILFYSRAEFKNKKKQKKQKTRKKRKTKLHQASDFQWAFTTPEIKRNQLLN